MAASFLTPSSRPLVGAARPAALSAAAGGVAAPAVALLLLWAVGLVGWFAADGGSHGSTRSVLRVAADGWLLAHGAHLTVAQGVAVTASPLGLTLACLALAFRFGRWAGRTSEIEDLRAAGGATVVLAGVYALTALVVAVLASAPGAEPGLRTAFVGGAAVGALGGGTGILRGAGLASSVRAAVPIGWLASAYTGLLSVGLLVTAGALSVAAAVAVRGAAVANVTEQLRLDATGAVLSLLLVAALAPNLALLASGYLLGPGFALGAGTVVAPEQVRLGPVPTVPVLGALPPDGWAPAGMVAVGAVPVLCAAIAAVVVGRVLPTRSYRAGAGRAVSGALVAVLVLAVMTAQAGGAVGPGRMRTVGVDPVAVALSGVLLLVPATLLAALAVTWWSRRCDVPAAEHAAVGAVGRGPSISAAGPGVLPAELRAPGAPVTVPRPRVAPTPEDLSTESTARVPVLRHRPPPT